MAIIQKSSFNTKKLIPVILLAVLLIGGGVYYFNKKNDTPAKSNDPTIASDYVNYDPATDEDKQRADANKQDIVTRDEQEKNQPATQPGNTKAVKPIITYADVYDTNVEVGAYVSDIFEDGGTCTAIFTKGSASFTKVVTAVKGANSVNCPVMSVPLTQFPEKGAWQVAVSYNSSAAKGSSDTKQLELK